MSMEPAPIKEYIYHSLNSSNQEIRLITIKAGRESDPVECSLAHVSLADKPQYEALSYVWGNPNDRSRIVLEGCDFSVTRNLGTALSYLRLSEVNRTMWIDAICIDQSNVAEREAQVSLMRNIYQEANQVVSWMGPLENGEMIEDRLVALDTIFLLSQGQRNNFQTAWLRDVLSSDVPHFGRISRVVTFCSRYYEYWRRIWITQEVAIARKGVVKWGKTTIPYEYFVKFSHTLSEVAWDVAWMSEHLGFKNLNTIGKMAQVIKENDVVRRVAPGTPLLDLLQQNQHKKASDPRDMVYALLGLSDMAPNSHGGLRINYGENWSKREVYTGIVRAVVHKTSRLEIICHAQHYVTNLDPNTSNQETQLPSWAPDWTTARTMSLSSTKEARIGASGLIPANVEFYEDKSVMKARGVCVGTVGTCGRCLPRSLRVSDPKEIMLCKEIFREWLELCRSFAGDSPETFDTFCRTACLGIEVPPAWRRLLDGTNQHSDPSNSPSAFDAAYFELMHDRMSNCRIFTIDPIEDPSRPSEDPPLLCGIGPEDLQANDKICVLLGCKYPVALRPDGNRFKFVCPVFVDGLWDGQAIEGIEMGRYSWDWFEMH